MTLAAGCKRHDDPICPNLPIANGLLGQTNYSTGAPNAAGLGNKSLRSPNGPLASNGQVAYLADTGNNRILGYNAIPTGVAPAADFELGQGDAVGTDFTHAVAAAGAGALSAPSKAATSADGRLVVADTGNNRVLIWNTLPLTNAPPNVVVGQVDLDGRFPNQKLAAPTAATLRNPTAAIIANGLLIVVDQGNNRVLIWNAVPSTNNAPADIELGQPASMTSGGTTTSCTTNSGATSFCFTTAVAGGDAAATSSAAAVLGMSTPTDVWTDGIRLLISDTGNNRVLYWSQVPVGNNAFYSNVIGQFQPAQNSAGIGSQRFNAPAGVYADGSNIFVGDAGNNRVLEFTGFPLHNGAAAAGVFGQSDFEHVAANDNNQDGAPGDQHAGGSVAAPTFNTLNSPTGVFVSGAGELYVADLNNHRVMMFPVPSAVTGTTTNLCNGINPQLN